ncbi:4-hydroxy-tetrahydrodipicolinate synthase [Oscillibacter sp. MSJ-2]|uniref:4-hydroxy-tetrahydrodipicolinate synthase n=1 Tax=Dysosmobacter acutus TaxID=2841504 RepID=A0ABS6F5H9_9FIRM|nr:4-hydroxy-tetrahydrodipicolinate synthase [Dysosmobacter acutus]MBU5625530.1 4-hydroxy-tetrahydrodipicolinate synthase [Dysosmobacter acutus]
MSFKPQGIIAAMVTCMHDDESLNTEEIRRQVERHIEAGANGVFCLGTNGEAYILSEEEKITVIKTVVDQVNGRVPVYAGTGMPGTRETIRMSQIAADCGADVLSVISPYFAAISQDELTSHYTVLAKAVDLPIVLYNMPARTGNNLAPDTVAKLSQVDGIVGIKDSSGNFDNMLQYIEKTDSSSFSVLSGNDSLIFWNLLAGGCGGITAVANIYPHVMVSIYQNFKKGDLEAARAAQESIRPIRNCFKYGNPNTITKKATNLAGFPVGPCRAPFCGLSNAAVSAIAETLDADKRRGMN